MNNSQFRTLCSGNQAKRDADSVVTSATAHYVVNYPVPKQPYKTLSILKLRRTGQEPQPGMSLVPYGDQLWLSVDAPFFLFARVDLQHIITNSA